MAHDIATVQDIVRRAARRLTSADGATFVLREEDRCWYVDEDAIEPLWKGRRFPMDACISGWSMLHREAAVIPDIYADDRVPHDAYRPTFVHSLVMVPIRSVDPIGAIGAYWATRHEASDHEVSVLRALADTTAVALENVRLWSELDARVRARTRELSDANQALQDEVVERKVAEARIRQLSMTDDLSGLLNRRGFMTLAPRAMASAPRGAPAMVVFADVDGLKQVNDDHGHEAGDRMLVAAADVLRACFREGDVVARLGGDEFAAYVPFAAQRPESLLARLAEAVAQRNAAGDLPAVLRISAGVAMVEAPSAASLAEVLSLADAAMYRTKRGVRSDEPPAVSVKGARTPPS